MTYADELRTELERQIEFRRLPPALMNLIEAYAEARGQEGYRRACREVSALLTKQDDERAAIESARKEAASA